MDDLEDFDCGGCFIWIAVFFAVLALAFTMADTSTKSNLMHPITIEDSNSHWNDFGTIVSVVSNDGNGQAHMVTTKGEFNFGYALVGGHYKGESVSISDDHNEIEWEGKVFKAY